MSYRHGMTGRPYEPQGRRSDLEAYIDDTPHAITVQHGNLRLAFPAGTTQAAIDAHLKKVDTASKASRRKPTRPTIPGYGKSAKPSAAMLKASSERLYRGPGAREVGVPGGALLGMSNGMPEAYRQAMIDQAARELTKWSKDDPHGYGKFMAMVDAGKVEQIATVDLERIVSSILRPGGRVSGKFGASLIYGLEELAKREQVAA